MASRRAQREESWDSLHYSEVSTEVSENMGGIEDDTDEQGTPHLRTIGDVHRALHPLQATADRVGRQVEQFAETLDRLSSQRSTGNAQSVNDIIPIVWEFEKIATETVKRLKRHHDRDRQDIQTKQWRERLQKRSGGSNSLELAAPEKEKVQGNFSTVEDLQHWEQERQTWQLLRLMLQVKDKAASEDPTLSEGEGRFRRPHKPTKIHRYSPETEVWNSYLAEDDDMWERNVVVEWLKATANSSALDIDTIIEVLEDNADSENVLSAKGWMYSKEAIKAQKRLRSWPQPLDPGSPGLDAALANTGRTEGTISQLDPDAVTRQDRALDKGDVLFEKATWLGCWEMVRRGRNWGAIREWCQERTEGWKALSLRGDSRSSYGNIPDINNDSATDWQTRSLWRKMCLRVAKEGGTDDFERAVYGVLSGDLPSVLKVTYGWDDYLFAVYNSQLLQGFDSYIQKSFPERLPKVLRQDKTDFGNLVTPFKAPPEHTWQGLITADQTKEEAKQPMKMIQGSIIASKVSDFITNQGRALGKDIRAKEDFRRSIRTSGPASPIQGPVADISLDDHDILRILTHIIFIFMDLKPNIAHQTITPIENIIFAYVDYLGKAGKQQLLPLYASRLSPEGATECMTRQLPYITEHSERRTVIRLMQQYGMDVPAILQRQLQIIMSEESSDSSQSTGIPKPNILDKQNPNNDGMPSIINGFIGEEITMDQQDLIHGVEWYLLLDGHWQETMWAGKEVYLHFLRTGALAAARLLLERVNFSKLSLSKTRHILGKAVDLSDDRLREQYDSDKTRMECEILIDQSVVFQDLESLVIALDCLENWKIIANEHTIQNDLSHAREYKSQLQNAHDSVCQSINVLLLSSWLQQPENEAEAASLSSIRLAYLPDLTLAYISVLTFDGHLLSRDILLTTMDLAAAIADNSDSSSDPSSASSSGLANVFVQAGRMAELVDVLAKASICLLRADEFTGRKKKPGTDTTPRRRKGKSGSLGIWRVKGQGADQK